MDTHTLLIAEDDDSLAKILCKIFEENGFTTYLADNGLTALSMYHTHLPKILLVDIDMPEMNGWELLSKIRKTNQSVPIIIMTGHRIEESDSLKSYGDGATSFIRKPLHPKETLAHVKSIFQLVYGTTDLISFGNFQLNMLSFALQTKSKKYELREIDAKILYLLAKHFNQRVNKEEFLFTIWKYDAKSNEKQLRNGIVRLKKIFEESGEVAIHSNYGIGYVLSAQ